MEIRRYGKTTGAVLEALGKAVANPGTECKINDIDETPGVAAYKSIMQEVAADMIFKLDLHDIIIKKNKDGVYVKSKYLGYLVTDSGTFKLSAEEVE